MTDPEAFSEMDRRSVLRAMGVGVSPGVGGLVSGDERGGGTTGRDGAGLTAARNRFYSGWAVAGKTECFRPDEREIYGPTDITAQTGNGRLSVALNDAGTMTVFRWPYPSFYDQLKYFTTGRGADDAIQVPPNEGAFLGVAAPAGDGFETTWLRDMAVVEQAYASDRGDRRADSPTRW
jgi:hypothetical protein